MCTIPEDGPKRGTIVVLAEVGQLLFSCPKSTPFPQPPLLSDWCFHLTPWRVANFMMKFGEVALEEPEANHGAAQTLGACWREAGPALALTHGPGSGHSQRVTATQHLTSTCLPPHLKLPVINGAESLINENQLSCAYRYLDRLNN